MSDPQASRPTIRADKWLWHARFFKTRGLATKLVAGGHLRINAMRISKPAHGVGPGDVLTFPQARRIRVVRILALAERRGPASEARALYEDLTPEPEPAQMAPRSGGGRRPTGKERRNRVQTDRSALD